MVRDREVTGRSEEGWIEVGKRGTESMDFAASCHLGTSPLALGNAATSEEEEEAAAEEEEFLDLDLEDEDLEREPEDLLSFLKTEGMASSSNGTRDLERPLVIWHDRMDAMEGINNKDRGIYIYSSA